MLAKITIELFLDGVDSILQCRCDLLFLFAGCT